MAKRNKIFLLSIGGVGLVALSGCLGTTTTPVAATPVAATPVGLAPISGTNTAAAPTAIKGKTMTYNALGSTAKSIAVFGYGARIDNSTNAVTDGVAAGSINGSTRAVSVKVYSLAAPNPLLADFTGTADSSGKVTSANGDTLIPDTSINQTGYNYVGIADAATHSGTSAYTGVYVMGIPTLVEDTPGSGTATYAGPAVVKGLTGVGASATRWALTGATATVTANFLTNKVDAIISGTAGASAPLDKITMSGAQVSTTATGVATFQTIDQTTGSIIPNSIKTFSGTTDVSSSYSGASSLGYGSFYGYNSAKTGTLNSRLLTNGHFS